MTPLFLFSGIFFPLDSMPRPCRHLAFFTPLYHLVNICRAFSAGTCPGWRGAWSGSSWSSRCSRRFPFKLMRKRIIV